MIIEINPDKQKSKSLKEMALITLERLKETNQEKYPTNTLADYYEIVHKLMESLTTLEGIKIKGEGAHIEIINFICEYFKFNNIDKEFLQEIREHRNRIAYEGFNIKENYIIRNKEKINKIIQKLLELINKKLWYK